MGWRRLRLLRQVGNALVSGVEQFLLVDDVVAVEDGPALVPGQEHGDPFGDAEISPSHRHLSQARFAVRVGAARKAVVYRWEARKRTVSTSRKVRLIGRPLMRYFRHQVLVKRA